MGLEGDDSACVNLHRFPELTHVQLGTATHDVRVKVVPRIINGGLKQLAKASKPR